MGIFTENLNIIYVKNPFRILKSNTSTTIQSIQQKYREERLNLQLDDSGNHEELDNLRQAQSDLLDSRKRWKHAFTWFYTPPQSIVDGKIALVRETETTFMEKAEKPGLEGIRSKQDLATWLLVLAIHSQESKMIIHYCVRSIALWSELIDDPLFTGMIHNSYKDHVFNDDLIWEIAVLDPLKQVLMERSSNGEIGVVCSFIKAVMEAGFTSEDIMNVSESSLENIGQSAEISMGQIMGFSNPEELPTYEKSTNEENLTNEKLPILLDSIYDLQEVLETLQEGNGEDSSGVIRWVTFLDNSAKRLRNLASEYVDILVENALARTERNPSYRTTANFLMKGAEFVAMSNYTRNEIEITTKTLWYNLNMADALNHIEHGLFKFASAAAKKALEISESPQEREPAMRILQSIREQSSRSSLRGQSDSWIGNWQGLMLKVVLGIIIFIVVMIVTSFCVTFIGLSQPTQIESNKEKLLTLEASFDTLYEQDRRCIPQEPYFSSRSLHGKAQALIAQHKELAGQTNALIQQHNSSPI